MMRGTVQLVSVRSEIIQVDPVLIMFECITIQDRGK